MTSAAIEPDPSGTFVGSSYSYATARDWARFGLLYLRDGVWDGARLLPEGWVDYSRTPASAAPHGEYGAHFWLNAGVPERGVARPDARAPADLFYASGHEGQVVAIVPSRDLVIVRLGLTPGDGRYDLDGFVAEVIAAFAEVRN
jgi:CubicO group peptidase (beta-lactamase class C family)